MEDYHELNVNHYNKDWEYWDVGWESDEDEKPAKPEKQEAPKYRSFEVREKDGSTTYYSVRESEPVRLNGYMI